MANERAYTAVNAGTKDKPIWKIWFAVTVADAVKLTDDPNDARTITDYVNQKIADLIGGAPDTYDTLKEISDYIASHQSVADAINAAIANKADKTVASTNANGLMSKDDKIKLSGIATGANNYVHPDTPDNIHIPAGGASGQILRWQADGTAQWGVDNNTTYSDMTAAAADKAGTHGLVPAPAAGAQVKYLRGDGTWQTPSDTTYADMKGATASAAGIHGLVPAPAAGGQEKYLRGDGSWQVPTNTTYAVASTTANGLMSKEDKAKVDGMPTIDMGTTYPSTAPTNSLFLLIKE